MTVFELADLARRVPALPAGELGQSTWCGFVKVWKVASWAGRKMNAWSPRPAARPEAQLLRRSTAEDAPWRLQPRGI